MHVTSLSQNVKERQHLRNLDVDGWQGSNITMGFKKGKRRTA